MKLGVPSPATKSYPLRWWLGLPVLAAVLVGLAGQPAGARGTTWTIHFTGSGSYQSNASDKLSALCSSTHTSSTQSEFKWTVTWYHVVLSAPPVTGNIRGILTGTAHETYESKTDCPGAQDVHCSKEIAFHADESFNGQQPAALLLKKSASTDILTLDLIASAAETQGCGSVDPEDHGFFFTGTPTSDIPGATDAIATTLQLPMSELRHSGKIVALAKKSAFNFPGPGETDCSDKSLGLTCSHDQSWSGTVTMTKV